MSNNLLWIVILAFLFYLFLGGNSIASTTATQSSGGGDCVQSLQGQYRAQWAGMSKLDRAIVGLRMSACEGGR